MFDRVYVGWMVCVYMRVLRCVCRGEIQGCSEKLLTQPCKLHLNALESFLR